VEDILPEGGGVTLDRDRLLHKLEGVRDLEEVLCGFLEVPDLGGLGRGLASQAGGEVGR
jgi:hypothetical protein